MIRKYRLLKIYLSGLLASVKVIRNGNDLSIREIDSYDPENNKVTDRFYSVVSLPFILYKKIVRGKFKCLNVNYSELIYAGHTFNNIKEFDFFYESCSDYLEVGDRCNDLNNLVFFEKGKNIKFKSKNHLIVRFGMSFILFLLFLTRRIKLNNTSLKYTLDYTNYFLFYYFNFNRNNENLPSVIVLSNDHTPHYLAISKVSKFFSIKRIYMQHGSVSEIFPTLDFELSVLRDKASYDIYNKLGPIAGDVVRLSRAKVAPKAFCHDPTALFDIVIMPSSVVDEIKLISLIKKLKNNRHVGVVYIKPHPRFKVNDVIKSMVEVINQLEGDVNNKVIIAGNSSVALEVKLQGYDVYQCFDIDDIERDYYGYVTNNLIAEIKLSEIDTFTFCATNKDIESNLKQYSPLLEGVQTVELSKFHDFISRSLSLTARHNKKIQETRLKDFINKKYNKEIISSLFEGLCQSDALKLLSSLHIDKIITYDEYQLVKLYVMRKT